MRYQTWPALIAVALLISGCKTTVSTPVLYSDFFAPAAYIDSRLRIEIASCKDSDSGFDSSALLEVKNRVPAVFPKARFLACRQIQFDSFAEFSIPIRVGDTMEPCGNSDLCIFPEPAAKNRVAAVASKEFSTGYARLQASMQLSMDTVIELNVTNDSGSDVPLGIVSMRINDYPYHFRDFTLGKGQSVTMVLSDVCTEAIVSGDKAVLFLAGRRQ